MAQIASLLLVLLLSTCTLSACKPQAGSTPGEKRTLSEGVETIKIVVDEAYYGGDGSRLAAAEIDEPFDTVRVLEDLIRGIGLKIAREPDGPFDAMLTIKVSGHSGLATYAGNDCYSSAGCGGEVSLVRSGKVLVSKGFSTETGTPDRIRLRDCPKRPEAAPFLAAFRMPRGAIDALFDLITEFWGPERFLPLAGAYPYPRSAGLALGTRATVVLSSNGLSVPRRIPHPSLLLMLPAVLALNMAVKAYLEGRHTLRRVLRRTLKAALLLQGLGLLWNILAVGLLDLVTPFLFAVFLIAGAWLDGNQLEDV